MKNLTYFVKNVMLIKCLSVILITSISSFVGCNDDNDKSLKRFEIIIIAPKLELSGTLPPTNDQVNVMVATKENSDQKYYLYIGRIEGFEYTEGYEYKLKVLITTIKNPPMDGHSEKFQLIELISNTEVDIEQ